MAVSVKQDIIRGSSIHREGFRITARRLAHVSGLTGDPWAIQASALGASGIAQWGDPYPCAVFGWQMYCYAINVSDFSDDSVEVEQLYTVPDPSVCPFSMVMIEGGATLSEIQTPYDASGSLIRLAYTGAPTQVVTLPKLIPGMTYTLSRLEYTDPTAKAKTYTGYRNSGIWKSFAIGTALMTNISYTSENSGLVYRTRYSVQYDPTTPDGGGGWKKREIYRLPTGQVPTDITEGNGQITVDMQPTIDFSPLSL